MIIEKYVANPAANTFNYVQVTLNATYRVTACCAFNDYNAATMAGIYLVYKGFFAAWAAANNEFLVYAHHHAYSTAVGYGWISSHEVVDFELTPGDYTFAFLSVTDVANLKFVYHLRRVS